MLARALSLRCLSALRQISSSLLRYDSSMVAQGKPPSEPLVVVLGTTGTGKSDLAVDLACRFNGEVINADAMQMYKGLPIITNKISVEEQRGIPHHLLGNIGLDEPTWTVHEFRREASRVIREIRSRGRLPIVVGGTHYYADGLLFDDRLVTRADEVKAGGDQQQDDPQLSDEEPSIQDAPTETLLARLREVDPVIAERWHPNDRRKIWRSLQIYLTTGRRASDIYAEQQRRRDEAKVQNGATVGAAAAPWNILLFWVYSRRDVLNARLDRRVDTMLERGLVDETRELHDYYLKQVAAGSGNIDRTSGVWQSIGFAQMEPYLDALRQQQQQGHSNKIDDDNDGATEPTSPARLETLRRAGIEAIKGATRRYAKHQTRWITYKTLPLLQEKGGLGHLFVMDSTGGGGAWAADVVDKAAGVAARYLAGDALPAPRSLSETAAEVLRAGLEAVNGRRVTWSARTCDVCRTTLVTEELWQTHVNGNRHKRAVKAAQRRALAVRENRPTALTVVEGEASSADDMPSLNELQI